MKKAISFLLILCLTLCALPGCGSGTPLTAENYEQYLSINAYCMDSAVRCGVKPVTTNYDFNDVVITIKVRGEYTVRYRTFVGYNAEGVPRYDCTQFHSEGSYEETFTLRLNIGGTVINTDECYVNLTSPSGTTINSGTCEYEIISITGSVSRVK